MITECVSDGRDGKLEQIIIYGVLICLFNTVKIICICINQ